MVAVQPLERCDMQLSSRYSRREGEKAFTLVEVLVVAPIIILSVGALVTVIINLTGKVIEARADAAIVYDMQDALNSIEEDIEISGRYLATSQVVTASPQGSDNSTGTFANINSSLGTMLILKMVNSDVNESIFITNTQMGLSEPRRLVYKNTPNSCSSDDVVYNDPYYTNVIYFIQNDTLWRRTVYDASSTPCVNPWEKPSCAKAYVGSSSYCTVEDRRILDGITSIDTEYFATASSTTATNTSQTNANDRQTALNATQSVKVTLITSNRVAGRNIINSLSIRTSQIQTY